MQLVLSQSSAVGCGSVSHASEIMEETVSLTFTGPGLVSAELLSRGSDASRYSRQVEPPVPLFQWKLLFSQFVKIVLDFFIKQQRAGLVSFSWWTAACSS